MGTTTIPLAPQGNIPQIGIPDSVDIPRLVFTAPYHQTVPLAELIEPSVIEAVEAALPALVPPYVQAAANEAVATQAVMLTGSTMSGPLFLNPVLPTQPSQAASMSYVDLMVSTAGVPEVPPTPIGQVWARETGQWVPVSQSQGVFLPITGGTMQGAINMSGNTINNLATLPVMPNGAAPATWVLNQIAAQSLYQGTWAPETNVPDLTLPGSQQNEFSWIAVTANTSGVVISQPIPGLQGLTVFNGDSIIFSSVRGVFQAIHAGGLSLSEAEALFVPFAGGQMSGALLLNANATSAMQATTLQQVQSLVTFPEAPGTGQLYGRNGVTASWTPVLPLAGGILSGSLTLAGNAVSALQPVTLQQLGASLGTYVPLAGSVSIIGPLTMSGAAATFTLSGNAATNLQAVPLQQLTGTLGVYLPLTGGIMAAGTGGAPSVALGTAGNGLYASAANTVSVAIQGANRVNVNASGLGIQGTLTATGAADVGALNASASSSVTGNLAISGTTSSAALITSETGAPSITCTGTGIVYAQITVANAWQFWLNGAVPYARINGTNDIPIGTPSDERLKEDIEPSTFDGLGAVLATPLWQYKWKASGKEQPIGFVAQRSLETFPSAVTGQRPHEDGTDMMMSMDPLALLGAAYDAIRQLNGRVAVLEAAA